jgi:hypothetical protein
MSRSRLWRNHFPVVFSFAWTVWVQALLTLLSKFFSPFPRGTCLLSAYPIVFNLGRLLSPVFILYYQTILLHWNPTITLVLVSRAFHPLWLPDGKYIQVKDYTGLRFRLNPDHNSQSIRLRFSHELFSLHSPLLRECCLVSFPPLINMLKLSG